MTSSTGAGNSRLMIRVGDVEIDLTGSQKEVDAEMMNIREGEEWSTACLLYTSPSPRDRTRSRMPSSA